MRSGAVLDGGVPQGTHKGCPYRNCWGTETGLRDLFVRVTTVLVCTLVIVGGMSREMGVHSGRAEPGLVCVESGLAGIGVA